MVMHSDGKPEADPVRCTGCRTCAKYCEQGAVSFRGAEKPRKAYIDHGRCVGCGRCIGTCNFNAIANPSFGANDDLNRKMAEYAKAVLDGRPHFHISVVNQVSPFCDCHGENDAAVVPDIGIFAGFDPVALDKACIDAVNAAPVLEGSIVSEKTREHGDLFTDIHPVTDWRSQIAHAEKIGLGRGNYELVPVS
jgi:uncharacterized Fe-S center protein